MNKRTSIMIGLLSLLLIGTVSAAVLTTTPDNTAPSSLPFNLASKTGTTTQFHPPTPSNGKMNKDNNRHLTRDMKSAYEVNLTVAQRAELNATIKELRQQNATPQEIQAAINTKLNSFGVFDNQLTQAITHTQQQLTILQREQALRTQGYNWTTIQTMITQEFGEHAFAYTPFIPFQPMHPPHPHTKPGAHNS